MPARIGQTRASAKIVDTFVRTPPTGARYEFPIDLDDWNGTLAKQVRLVPRGSRVLEIGSSTGFMSAFLEARGCEVVGLELDRDAVGIARGRGLTAYSINLTDHAGPAALRKAVGHDRFDVVLCGDVLEHVPDPAELLTTLRAFLRPSGRVVASLPNVAHGSIRLDLLRGRFLYTSAGLLDRTHLQLFTLDSIATTFAAAGFTIEPADRCYIPIFGAEGRVNPGELPTPIEEFVQRDRESWVYQYVVCARPVGLTMKLRSPLTGVETPDLVVVEIGGEGGRTTNATEWADLLPIAAPIVRVRSVSTIDAVAEVASGFEPSTPVLVVPMGALPEASWVQALWHRLAGGGAVGARLVTLDGVTVHAGATASGDPALAGLWEDHPLVAVGRSGPLLPPYLATAGAIVSGAARNGSLVATAKARIPVEAPTAGASDVREACGSFIVALSSNAPAAMASSHRTELWDLVHLARASGRTVALRSDDDGLMAGRLANSPALEHEDLALYTADVGIDAVDADHRRILNPHPVELVRDLSARLIVFLDEAQERKYKETLVAACPSVELFRSGTAAVNSDPRVRPLADIALAAQRF